MNKVAKSYICGQQLVIFSIAFMGGPPNFLFSQVLFSCCGLFTVQERSNGTEKSANEPSV
jgi:hypothetical protein